MRSCHPRAAFVDQQFHVTFVWLKPRRVSQVPSRDRLWNGSSRFVWCICVAPRGPGGFACSTPSSKVVRLRPGLADLVLWLGFRHRERNFRRFRLRWKTRVNSPPTTAAAIRTQNDGICGVRVLSGVPPTRPTASRRSRPIARHPAPPRAFSVRFCVTPFELVHPHRSIPSLRAVNRLFSSRPELEALTGREFPDHR